MAETQLRSHLLGLPAELRNQIYELVFSETAKEIDLREVQPPSKALLFTCREIYEEATPVRREAYRAFWSSIKFTLSMEHVPTGRRRPWDMPGWLIALSSNDLAHVTRFVIFHSRRAVIFYCGLSSIWTDDAMEEQPAWVLDRVELWVRKGQQGSFQAAGFQIGGARMSLRQAIVLTLEPGGRRMEAKKMAGQVGLTKFGKFEALWESENWR